jgi:hypothetical protein
MQELLYRRKSSILSNWRQHFIIPFRHEISIVLQLLELRIWWYRKNLQRTFTVITVVGQRLSSHVFDYWVSSLWHSGYFILIAGADDFGINLCKIRVDSNFQSITDTFEWHSDEISRCYYCVCFVLAIATWKLHKHSGVCACVPSHELWLYIKLLYIQYLTWQVPYMTWNFMCGARIHEIFALAIMHGIWDAHETEYLYIQSNQVVVCLVQYWLSYLPRDGHPNWGLRICFQVRVEYVV